MFYSPTLKFIVCLLGAIYVFSACGRATPTVVHLIATVSPPNAVTTDSPTRAATLAPASAPTQDAAPVQPTAPTQAPTQLPNPVQSNVSAHFFGANTNGEIINNEQARALAILGGVQMVRTSVDWNNIEKNKGKYDWSYPDDAFKRLTENNFVPLVMIMNNPDWAANSPCGPVDDLTAFGEFVTALAARYSNIKYWALYNEPDNAHYPQYRAGGCFGGQDLNSNGKADYIDYAAQLRIAWRAIHQANPDAQLVLGALAFDNFDASAPSGYPGAGKGGWFNFQFFPELLKYIQANPLPNGEKYFDIVAFNFYALYAPYWEQQTSGVGISAKTNVLRKLLNDAGINVPLLVSETGANSQAVGDDGQSDYIGKTFVRGMASDLVAVLWWTFQDFPDSNPPPTNTWKYGLLDQDGKPKTAYAAFQNVSHQLTDAQFSQPLQVNGGEGYLFLKDGGGRAVLWSNRDTPASLTFAASVLQATDVYGATVMITDGSENDHDSAAGRIGIQVGESPVFVQLVK